MTWGLGAGWQGAYWFSAYWFGFDSAPPVIDNQQRFIELRSLAQRRRC